MDVSLTDEQVAWQRALERLASVHAVTGADLIARADDAAAWDAVLGLGIPALRSEEHSGAPAAGVESALAVEAMGRTLSTAPIVGQAVIAPELLARAGASEALNGVLEGTLRFSPAFSADLRSLATVGEPAVAFDAAGATHALALAPDGRLTAFELGAPTSDGLDLTRTIAPLPVGASMADLGLGLGGTIDEDARQRCEALALTALAADLLGVMDGAVADAVRYAAERKQFGVAIGTFQAVQHLLADAAVQVEGARSCVWHAAWSGDHDEPAEALLAARVAKAYCSAAGMRVVEATVQVFGGIAITWEHASHLRLRRVHLDRECLGDEHVQHLAIARMRLGIGEVA